MSDRVYEQIVNDIAGQAAELAWLDSFDDEPEETVDSVIRHAQEEQAERMGALPPERKAVSE